MFCNAMVIIGDDIAGAELELAVAGMDTKPAVVISLDRSTVGRGHRTWIEPDLVDLLATAPNHGRHLVVDDSSRTLFVDGAPVPLSPLEFDLLAYLMKRPGSCISREELGREVWGFGGTSAATITVHISQLRRKIEHDPRSPRHLCTIQRSGYRFDP